jgi:type I protein arginine methyltransferase
MTRTLVEYYFKRYGDLELHRRMIGDRWRMDAFARAIASAVRPGDAVLDLGTGTGVLAMLCARAGARRVYAIDQSDIVQSAANLVKANHLADVVRILRGPSRELAIEEKVDLIVSEWLGHLALVEGMLDDVLAARDAHLAENGRMMPSHVSVMLAPIDDPVLYGHDGPGFWREPVHGLDFSTLEELELKQGKAVQLRVEPAALLAAGQPLVELDLSKAHVGDAWATGSLDFEMKRDGVLNGFVGWFVAQLSPSERLDSGPLFPETHWSQSYFSFEPRTVKRGATIEVDYQLTRDPEEPRNVRLELKVGRTAQEFCIE